MCRHVVKTHLHYALVRLKIQGLGAAVFLNHILYSYPNKKVCLIPLV